MSETLNETQGELEKLIKDHERLTNDYQKEVRENK